MKLNGKKLDAIATAEAVIPRDGGEELRFLIRSIPMGFVDDVKERLPKPRTKRVNKGKGANRKSFIDYQDPGYIEEVVLRTERINTMIIYHALGADKRISFEAVEGDNLADFADEVHREMSEAGLTDGDLGCLVDQIDILSNATDEQLQEARERFLSGLRGAEESQGSDSPSDTE